MLKIRRAVEPAYNSNRAPLNLSHRSPDRAIWSRTGCSRNFEGKRNTSVSARIRLQGKRIPRIKDCVRFSRIRFRAPCTSSGLIRQQQLFKRLHAVVHKRRLCCTLMRSTAAPERGAHFHLGQVVSRALIIIPENSKLAYCTSHNKHISLYLNFFEGRKKRGCLIFIIIVPNRELNSIFMVCSVTQLNCLHLYDINSL